MALTALPFLRRLLLLMRVHEHDHRPPFEPGRLLNSPVGPKQIGKLVEKPPPNVRVRHFAPAEKHCQFDFVTRVQEPGSLPAFGFEIVIIDLRPNADFLKFDNVLVAARFTLFPALLIPELAVIHEPANRRDRIRSDFDKIEPALTGHFQRISRRNDPNLLACLVDESNFPNPDSLIDARLHWSGNSSPPLGLN
jgi:hypothetical protein